jgi:hypothetical protein
MPMRFEEIETIYLIGSYAHITYSPHPYIAMGLQH